MKKREQTKARRENEYRINVYHPGSHRPALYRRIELDVFHRRKNFLSFVDRKFPGWTAINVYGGLTREYKFQITPDSK